ncbi:YdeI/OmpD-associated family protein [Algibacter sp. L3A6]|uniref:YdeI/OmpD-associated family protein n=1 Tax=Algibacter sp. L3A6 TaxID=2686366 RepID=UPI00131AB1A0|nr:YdeI/OmpD-associated family protein [Algibacter sp. L3A6]
MPLETPEFYFKTDTTWREWLHENHKDFKGVYLIFYKVENEEASMRWEEAVKVAICYGWIDSTVKSLGDGKRRQYYSPRNQKSVWSALNKKYIKTLTTEGLMHQSGLDIINIGKQNGSWTALDSVEKGIIPDALKKAFDENPEAFKNYQNFAPSYKKHYLFWLNSAKREATKTKRITEIIRLCANNIKSRDTW